MKESTPFFRPVGELARREVITCDAQQTVAEVARLMHEHGISGAVVCAAGRPVGIVTNRDLRSKLLAEGRDPARTRAAEIMSTPLATIAADRPLHEALHRMSRQGMHRLVLTDADGALAGMVTATDMLRLQAHSALGLVLDIEQAQSVDALAPLHRQIEALVVDLLRQGLPTAELVRTVARLNDQVLVRLIELVRAQQFARLSDRFAFLVLGSEGRCEQTLATDQDNAIVYADDLPADEVAVLERFSHAVIDALIGIGVPACDGGIMAKNDAWRRSLGDWQRTLGRWFATATPEHVMAGSMFFDMRHVYGDASLSQALQQDIAGAVSRNAPFLAHTAANVVRFAPPLGWFGRIKATRRDGRRTIDVKKAGLFAITEGVKVLAQQAGHTGGDTRERITALADAKVLGAGVGRELTAAFDLLAQLRLRAQVEAIEAGGAPVNHLDLGRLDAIATAQLVQALRTVRAFGSFLEQHFHLGAVR